jgi:ABC-type nitrate/sulfonate/bicarbonate transport system ATPase subunit
MGELLELDNVGKAFHTPDLTVPAVRDVSFTVREGEVLTIIGPSGCGKSTLLNILAGLVEPDQGSIRFKGGRPGVGYMPQRDLLLPWRRVIDNATLPLEAGGMNRSRAREAVKELVSAFGLEGFERAYPQELSGGMRQRVALLRTVATGSRLLLLDEPFGALDALTRREMQDWLLELQRGLRRTIVFITHDVDEAVYLADRVIVLSRRPGTVVRQLDVPLPRPRTQGMIARPEFGTSVAKLLADLGIAAVNGGPSAN